MPEPSPESVEALFQQAADLDPERRGAFLDGQCAGDPELRAAVEELLDFDAKARGTPYFVMEYGSGVPITEYCDAERVTVAGRLALFVQVCQAVQHAHPKGVIHRDLKPSNVLVAVGDGGPVPKVIDFGLAKATRQPLT